MIKKDNYDKRVIIATILSTILIVIWARYAGIKTFTKNNANDNQEQVIKKDTDNKEIVKISINEGNTTTEEESNNKVFQNDSVEERRIIVENEKLKGTINLKGLVFDDLVLKKYNVMNSEEKFHLLNKIENNDAYYVAFGWASTDKNMDLPNENTIWKSDNSKLTLNNPITLSYTNKQGIIFNLIISIDNDYMLNFTQKITNNSNNEINISIDNKIYKKAISLDANAAVHEGFVGSFDNTLEEIKYKKLAKKEFNFSNNFSWAGFTDKYWLVSFGKKVDKLGISNISTNFVNGFYIADFNSSNLNIMPKQEKEIEGVLFTGAKELSLLDQYSFQYNLALFDRSVDFGWFYFLTKPIYIILKTFYALVGNFGIAILILTFVVKSIMYPFTKKSFVSMAKLKKIQPKIDALKSRYPNDKMKLNKELVGLYKKEEISPLSGCFPMLVQIPVFFSLYKVLSISIDMRQAPFFGYIKNLSEKDPTTIWNLFGLLPYHVSFLPVGLLPCLMSLTMWMQQKMTAQGNATPESQAVVKYMPLIFLFLFAGMPSGLLIYWTFSNIITILQQYYIEKKLKY